MDNVDTMDKIYLNLIPLGYKFALDIYRGMAGIGRIKWIIEIK